MAISKRNEPSPPQKKQAKTRYLIIWLFIIYQSSLCGQKIAEVEDQVKIEIIKNQFLQRGLIAVSPYRVTIYMFFMLGTSLMLLVLQSNLILTWN